MGGRCLLPLLLLLASRSGSYTGAVSGELGGGRPLWVAVSGNEDCRGACGPGGAAYVGAMRLRGGGRAWIRKTIKGVRKKEKQRKKRNLDTTNLGQVKLEPGALPVGLRKVLEMSRRANEWLAGGADPEKMPVIMPDDYLK
ncbi:hypothetical protein T484DRAFT_1798027, partial [Baffinella frigidus]